MADQLTDDEVRAFSKSEEFQAYVEGLKEASRRKHYTLSPNDVPEVVCPLDRETLRRVFAPGFTA